MNRIGRRTIICMLVIALVGLAWQVMR